MSFDNFVKVGGGSGVVTNGPTMQEEPAEMEIPLEEEVVYSIFVSFLHVVTFLTKTSATNYSSGLIFVKIRSDF